VTPADIENQVGAAQGLWTHTPVDWAGNEGLAKPASWPTDASKGEWGTISGTRPGQGQSATVPPGGVVISAISVSGITATAATINFTLSSLPSQPARVNYGQTIPLGSSTAAASAAAGAQSIALSGLVTGKVYYYQVNAMNANGTSFSQTLAFTTA